MFEGISYHLQYSVRSALAVGVWKERQMKGEAGRAVLVFFLSLSYLLSSVLRGIDKGNKNGKVVFWASWAHDTLHFIPDLGMALLCSTVRHFRSTGVE